MQSPMEQPEYSTSLPTGLASGRATRLKGFAAGIRPDPELTVSQWADEHRWLSSKASAEAGQWRTSRTPYLAEIMDCATPSHPMADGVVMAGTQVGKTEVLLNVLGYVIHQAPGPAMVVQPTTDVAKKFSKQRVAPMIEETPALRSRVTEARSRDSGNTTLMKEFPGGLVAMVGANSGPGLRSLPIRYLLMDETDAYPLDVDGEGDPEEVAEKRTDTFGVRAKRIRTSSPKRKDTSRIDRRYREGSQGRYYVPCPHCAHEQYLRWPQMRWEMRIAHELACPECGGVSDLHDPQAGAAACAHCRAEVPLNDATARTRETEDLASAWYECESCGEAIAEHHKTAMLERGRWIHATPGPGQVLGADEPHPWAIWAWVGGQVRRYLPDYSRALSWHLPTLYSPLGWFAWGKAVRQYLRAQRGGYDDKTGEPLEQVFRNTVLAEAYEHEGERPAEEVLKLRGEAYRLGTVPEGALLLVAAVDVQGNRLEALCMGFGRAENAWIVDHQRFYGEPLDLGANGPWAQLDAWRAQAFAHVRGGKLRVITTAVDSGYLAHAVYYFVALNRGKEYFATKGMSQMGKPILGRPSAVDIQHRGQVIKSGAEVWPIGTDTAKERIYRALEIQPPADGEPYPHGYIHFPTGLPDEFYEQLTAERLERRRVRGQEVREWTLPAGKRNEILDLVALCMAAAERAGVRRLNWERLESALALTQADLLDEAAAAAPEASSPPAVLVPREARGVAMPPAARRERRVRI
jgi:phage terminase large subunit GpA-like protein